MSNICFNTWDNHQHRHSGIGMMTPASVHEGRAEAIYETRQVVLDLAFQTHPERFTTATSFVSDRLHTFGQPSLQSFFSS